VLEEAMRNASNGPTKYLSIGLEEASYLLTNAYKHQQSIVY
jgi:hypothetical protein